MGGLATASFCGRSLINSIFINSITFSITIHTPLIATKENIASCASRHLRKAAGVDAIRLIVCPPNVVCHTMFDMSFMLLGYLPR